MMPRQPAGCESEDRFCSRQVPIPAEGDLEDESEANRHSRPFSFQKGFLFVTLNKILKEKCEYNIHEVQAVVLYV